MGLAAQLRSLDDGRLAALLRVRHDLVEAHPRTFEQLASRAAAYGSQLACVAELDLFLHQLLELISVAGSPGTLARVAELAGPNVDADELRDGLGRLHDLGLVAVTPPTVRLIGDLAGRLGVPGLGRPVRRLLSGRTVEELRRISGALGARPATSTPRKADLLEAVADLVEDPARLRRVLDGAPPEVGHLLDALDGEGSATLVSYRAFAYERGRSTDPAERAARWLMERGLLVQTTWGTGEVVGEIGLLRRGGIPFPDITTRAPALEPLPDRARPSGGGRDLDPAEATARDAGAAAGRVVELVARLCHLLEAEPAPLLKAGGLGVRAVRRLADGLTLDEHDAATLVEIAAAAGLVSSTAGALHPAALLTAWTELDPVDRWLHLLRSWLSARAYLRAAGAPGEDGRPVAPLSGGLGGFDVVRQRRDLLEALATVPAGQAVERLLLLAHLVWRRPHLWAAGPVEPELTVAWFLDEAALLGAVDASGVLAPVLRAELAGDADAARAAATDALPVPESGFILQADHTVLALGALDPRIAGELGRFADVESRGAATVYRLTTTSVGRALQGGQQADDLLGFLDAHSRSGVPQPVRVLIEDVGRRYGRVRVGAAASFVRCDDPALLAELVRHRKLAKLGLRTLAPTVAASPSAPGALLTALTAAGYLPAEEDGSGELVVRRPATPPPRAAGRGLLAGRDAVTPAAAPTRAVPRSGAGPPVRVEDLVRQLRRDEELPGPISAPAPARRPSWAAPASGRGRGELDLALDLGGDLETDGQLGALFEAAGQLGASTDPRRFPVILRLAREAGLAVALGVYEDDDDIVDLVGAPLAVSDGTVLLRCADCDDVHHLDLEEIAWVELVTDGPEAGDGDGEEADGYRRRPVAPSSRTGGTGRNGRTGRRRR